MDSENLQAEKLRLEIKELNRHWIKNPQYLQVLLPTILAIFSLLYAITSGLFSSKQELLELNKKQLETDIKSFEKEKIKLSTTNLYLKKQATLYNDSLKNKNLLLRKYENSFTRERQKIKNLNDELSILKNTRDDYNAEIIKLQKEYDSKKEKYLKEIESKYIKEIDNEKKSNEQKKTIDALKEKNADLNYYNEILKASPYIIKGKEHEWKIWYAQKMIDYYNEKSKKNQKDLENLFKSIEKHQKSVDSLSVKNKVQKIK